MIIYGKQRSISIMLVAFEVKNYGPFYGKVRITTEADLTKKESLEENTFLDNGKRYNYVSYLYGYNGSGKSSFFKALLSMKRILTLSPLIATNNQQILESAKLDYEVTGQRNFFKFNTECADKPTCYSIELKIDETCYYYGFEIFNKKVVKEFLYRKNKRKELLLERSSERYDDIVVKSDLKNFENFLPTVKEDVLCLSMAMFLNLPIAVKIYNEINDISVINMATVNNAQKFAEEANEDDLEIYTKFLRLADKTIKKITYSLEKKEISNKIQLGDDFESRSFVIQNFKIDIESIHNVYTGTKLVGDTTLPFLRFESNGTIKLFGILPAIFKALKNGGTLCVDEIENGLHPNLTKLLISLFNDPETNPHNAQLICSSHDTLLLKNKVRRDQVWFLHKNTYGSSSLKRLSEFPGIRISDDVAKKYLSGAFGEIPSL